MWNVGTTFWTHQFNSYQSSLWILMCSNSCLQKSPSWSHTNRSDCLPPRNIFLGGWRIFKTGSGLSLFNLQLVFAANQAIHDTKTTLLRVTPTLRGDLEEGKIFWHWFCHQRMCLSCTYILAFYLANILAGKHSGTRSSIHAAILFGIHAGILFGIH